MFQIVNVGNVTEPLEEILGTAKVSADLRGYSDDFLVTGKFRISLVKERVRTLSVREISSRYCPTKRDLYIQKGRNGPRRRQSRGSDSFERKAGILGEQFFQGLTDVTFRSSTSYSDLKNESDTYYNKFSKQNESEFDWLKQDSSLNHEIFVAQLRSGGRVESTISRILSGLTDNDPLGVNDILSHQILNPNKMTGISAGSQPDFLITRLKMVGDVKSGEAIDVKHLLICAGYALAYENWKGEDINWGMIYLIKTKNSQRIGKYVSLPQIYIFPIDDDLRGFFIQRRNEALQIVSRPRLPKKPSSMKDRRLYCRDCVYRKVCEEDGLEVPE